MLRTYLYISSVMPVEEHTQKMLVVEVQMLFGTCGQQALCCVTDSVTNNRKYTIWSSSSLLAVVPEPLESPQ